MKTPYRAEFFRSLFSNPVKVGAVLPTGRSLGRLIGKELIRGGVVPIDGDGLIIELGPGTGGITRELLECGVPEDRLILVESERKMADYLRGEYPASMISNSNAFLLRQSWNEWGNPEILAIVSSLPVINFSLIQKRRLLRDCLTVLGDGRSYIQMTYSLFCPMSSRVGVSSRRLGWTPLNVPPVSLWSFSSAIRKAPGGRVSALGASQPATCEC